MELGHVQRDHAHLQEEFEATESTIAAQTKVEAAQKGKLDERLFEVPPRVLETVMMMW